MCKVQGFSPSWRWLLNDGFASSEARRIFPHRRASGDKIKLAIAPDFWLGFPNYQGVHPKRSQAIPNAAPPDRAGFLGQSGRLKDWTLSQGNKR